MDASFDPVAFTIGSLTVRWYGLMYVAGFLLGWLIGRIRAPRYGWKARDVDDLVTICMLGLVLGARIGYILFYDLPLYLDEPAEIFRFWNGGMSFHGGALGLAAAFFYFAKTRKKGFLDIADFITPLVPPGLFFGRMGNFINGELWGKVTTLPWGMIFPTGGPYPRHPSQLYEGFLEGIVLFIVLLCFTRSQRRTGQTAGLFCGICASARCPAGLPCLWLAHHGADFEPAHDFPWLVASVAQGEPAGIPSPIDCQNRLIAITKSGPSSLQCRQNQKISH